LLCATKGEPRRGAAAHDQELPNIFLELSNKYQKSLQPAPSSKPGRVRCAGQIKVRLTEVQLLLYLISLYLCQIAALDATLKQLDIESGQVSVW
jgi:hypothetical protein